MVGVEAQEVLGHGRRGRRSAPAQPAARFIFERNTMPQTAYNLIKESMKAAIWDREQTLIGKSIYDTAELKGFLDTIEKLEDALLTAMPFVTDAMECTAFKRGFVKADATKILEAIDLIGAEDRLKKGAA